MKSYAGVDLTKLPGAVAARRKPGKAAVVFAAMPGSVETLEGIVAYVAGDAIVTGETGERWPVGRELFSRHYTPAYALKMYENGGYFRKEITVTALLPGDAFEVPVPGGTLKGRKGDWLVQYVPGCYGIVQGELFNGLYDIEERQI